MEDKVINNTEQVNVEPKPVEQKPIEQPNEKIVYVNESNSYAIAGFVLSFFLNVLGLTFSILGLIKSKSLNGKGRGLAIAGVCISSFAFLLAIIGIIIALAGERPPMM